MNDYKIFAWLTKSWITGLFAFLSLAACCLFAGWSLNGFNPIHFTISSALPVFLLCIGGAVFIVYLSNNPARVQKAITERLEHLRQLNSYIENVREAERLNVSKKIHEELGQQLAVLKMDISRIGKKIAATDAAFSNEISGLLDPTNTMIETVRKISAELRPSMLDDIGLVATLDWYCGDFSKRTGIKTYFAPDITTDKLSKELNVGLFRIFQESLINVAKHSEAKRVDVFIKNHDDQLVLIIEDNGKGFDSSADKLTALGIRAMMERAQMLNGIYNVNSFPGKGTIVEICVPLGNSN